MILFLIHCSNSLCVFDFRNIHEEKNISGFPFKLHMKPYDIFLFKLNFNILTYFKNANSIEEMYLQFYDYNLKRWQGPFASNNLKKFYFPSSQYDIKITYKGEKDISAQLFFYSYSKTQNQNITSPVKFDFPEIENETVLDDNPNFVSDGSIENDPPEFIYIITVISILTAIYFFTFVLQCFKICCRDSHYFECCLNKKK